MTENSKDSKRKQAYIIAGANGSGKTTFARTLIEQHTMIFINADEIANTLKDNDKSSVRINAGRKFFAQLYATIELGKDLVIETTLSGKYLVSVMDLLRKQDYRVTLVYIYLLSPEQCIERIRQRVSKGGHHVPDEDVRRRYWRSLRNFWEMSGNTQDAWELYMNSDDEFHAISVGSKQGIFVIDESEWNRFTELLQT